MKTRDQSVDFVKGIAIIAVSFGHTMPAFYTGDFLTKWCYSFELAAFFIVSGYLQCGRAEREPRNFIRHNAISFLYPYATMTAVVFIGGVLKGYLVNGVNVTMQDLPLRICKAITWSNGAWWFLPTFFLAGLIAYYCRRNDKLPTVAKTAILMVFGSFLCCIAEKYGYLREVTQESILTASFWLWHLLSFIARSMVGASLIMIGLELKSFEAKKHLRLNNGGGYVLSASLLAFGLIGCYLNYGGIDLHFAFIRNPIWFYVTAISTTVAFLLIGKQFQPNCICWCGRESMLLMFAQVGMGMICEVIVKFINVDEMPYLQALMCSIAVLVISFVIAYYVIKLIHSTLLKILIVPLKKRGAA